MRHARPTQPDVEGDAFAQSPRVLGVDRPDPVVRRAARLKVVPAIGRVINTEYARHIDVLVELVVLVLHPGFHGMAAQGRGHGAAERDAFGVFTAPEPSPPDTKPVVKS